MSDQDRIAPYTHNFCGIAHHPRRKQNACSILTYISGFSLSPLNSHWWSIETQIAKLREFCSSSLMMEFRNFYVKVYSYEYTIFFAPRWKLVYMRTLEKRIQVRSRVMNEQMVQEEKNCWRTN